MAQRFQLAWFSTALFQGIKINVLPSYLLSVYKKQSYLVVFETAEATAFVVVGVLDFWPVDTAGLLVIATQTKTDHENEVAEKQNREVAPPPLPFQLCASHSNYLPVCLGLSTLTVSAASLFLVPFTIDFVPFVTVAPETKVALDCPTGFLSGTPIWFFTMEETAATPIGRLGTAPAAAAAADFVVVIFFTTAVETVLEVLTSLALRCEAVAGHTLDPGALADLAVGWGLLATAFCLILVSAATSLPLPFEVIPGVASFAASSDCNWAWSGMFP